MRPVLSLINRNFEIVAVTALYVSGCAVGPDFEVPPAPSVSSYTGSELPSKTASASVPGGEIQELSAKLDVSDKWWQLFASDDLNKLVEEAVNNNPGLEGAQAALAQAQENAYAANSGFFPSIDINATAQRQKISGLAYGQPNAPSATFPSYNASASLAYNLDIFGGTRRTVESLQAQVDSQKFQTENTYLNLIAAVVNAVVQEASLGEQIKETENIIGILQEQMKVLHDQLKLNIITKASVLSQEATLLETQATLPLLQKQRVQARNQLAALTGHFPSEMKYGDFPLDMLHLPEELPLTLPSKLVEQRPDIRAAEENLHAASAEIGVATARMLPQINLSANYGSAVRDINDLFLANSEVWNIGAGLMQPLFHGGQLLHAKRAAVARYDMAAAQYRNTVLLAFRDVADVLHSLKLDADALKIQADSAQVTAENLDVTRAQFKVGTISYLSLLDAERTHLQARLRLVEARARRMSDTVALFQALGGGWWNRSE